jgi:hypothetical protein
MIDRLAAAIAAVLCSSLVNATPGTCAAKSGATTVALVELYTSEGCDSCPPADRWLSALPQAGFGPERVVPLSLHVDYWDYIGWKDPFAKPLFSARQREIAAVNRSRIVYTPQVVLAGRDYRGWPGRARFAEAVAAVNAAPPRAELGLELRDAAAGAMALRATASVPRREDREDAALFVAMYENGLANRVSSGENRGATLAHDYVVRDWSGPLELDGAGTASLSRTVGVQLVANGGVAAFVQRRRTGEVLQALALPGCGR